MPILPAQIQVGGRTAPFATGSFSFWQITDYEGRPSTDVRLGLIELTLVGEEAAWVFWEEWMLDAHRRQSGRLIFFQNEDQKAKTVVFYDAFCVHFECRFDARGYNGKGSFEVELNLSAAAKEVQGQFSEAHSVIPWAADKDTRYRALTKPAEYLPSTALAAYKAAKDVEAAPSNMPAAAVLKAPNYLTTKMERQYVGEETGEVWGTEVKYLSAEERKAYELRVGPDGLLRDAQQQLFDTSNAKAADGSTKAIFVMSETGAIYAALRQKRGEFHHSSFLAGQPVAAAGELVVKQGQVIQASNRSGHYMPDQASTYQFVEQLGRSGAKDADKIEVVDFDY